MPILAKQDKKFQKSQTPTPLEAFFRNKQSKLAFFHTKQQKNLSS